MMRRLYRYSVGEVILLAICSFSLFRKPLGVAWGLICAAFGGWVSSGVDSRLPRPSLNQQAEHE